MLQTQNTLFGAITLEAKDGKLSGLYFNKQETPSHSSPETPQDAKVLHAAFEQLAEYFSGKRKTFRLPLAPADTDFRARVRNAMLAIPYGQTATYGETAARAGSVRAFRAVGGACHANEIPVIVPCHRVVAANNLGGYSSGLEVKTRLLNLEHFNSKEYWQNWDAQDKCVLMFLRANGKLLLIHKKRGLGKGKVNAPGGHIEQDETPEAAAIRETQEEVGITPLETTFRGRLRFAFLNGFTEECRVYEARDFRGKAKSSDEADPFWCDETALPYEQMWQDDRLWLPEFLSGKTFDHSYVFDDDRLLWEL